jgi:EAL domain-containing protein (putative c-di-GMP-specific phosphodiesterase class I)
MLPEDPPSGPALQLDAGDDVRRLLRLVRTQLGMELAWLSEFDGTSQVFRYVDAAEGVVAPVPGTRLRMSGSYCARVLDGRIPQLIPDARTDPATALVESTWDLQIGSYVGAPLLAPDGSAVGMLCTTSTTAMPRLGQRDLDSLRLVAEVLRDLQARALTDEQVRDRRRQLVDGVARCLDPTCRTVVLQPVVTVGAGRLVAVEGLSRFSVDEQATAQWFAAASRVGRRSELELSTAGSVLSTLPTLPSGVTVMVNLSPSTALTCDLGRLLAGVDPERVVLELTEHEPVLDYPALCGRLEPHRRRGVRIAVDDAGGGYASLRHVLDLSPDIVKLDMALVRGLDADPARRALVEALARFCCDAGRVVVAEGVETAGELAALEDSGVTWVQGFHIGRPVPVDQLLSGRARQLLCRS